LGTDGFDNALYYLKLVLSDIIFTVLRGIVKIVENLPAFFT
jgi:hypothetical protein